MLISKVAEKRDIPGEPGEWMKFFPLSAKKLRKAFDVRQGLHLEAMPATAVAVIFGDKGKKKKKKKNKADKEPLTVEDYDAATLLELSLDSWSSPQKPGDDPSDKIYQTTLDWAAQEIFDLSQPPTKADVKNFSGGSIAP